MNLMVGYHNFTKNGTTCMSLVLFVLILSSCNHVKSNNNRPFTAVLGPEPQTLDWQTAREAITGIISMNLMDGLFAMTPGEEKNSLIIENRLAESSQVSRDYKEWKICIKKEARWSDNSPVVANDFIRAWKRLLSPETRSPHAHHLFLIKGAESFYQGKIPFEKVGLIALNTNCLQIHLKKGTPLLKKILTTHYTLPMANDSLDSNGQLRLHQFKSTGAYTLKSPCPNQQLCLIPNPHHYLKRQVKPLNLLFVDNPKTALDLYKQKKVDWLRLQYDPMRLSAYPDLELWPSMGVTFLGFNGLNSETKSRSFRLALAQEINPSLLKKTFKHPINIATQMSHPTGGQSLNLPSYQDQPSTINFSNQDIKNSAIVLASNSSPMNQMVLEFYSYHLKKVFNRPIDIQIRENSSYFYQISQRTDHHLFRLSWSPSFFDPLGYLGLFLSKSPLNFFHYKNKRFDQIYQKALYTSDPTTYQKSILEMEQMLHQEIVALPLYYNQEMILSRYKSSYRPYFLEWIEFHKIPQSAHN